MGSGFEPQAPHQIGHCTNPWLGCGPIVRSDPRLRDAEDGDDPAWACELDLRYQRFDEGFALVVASRGDDLVDVIGYLLEGCRRRGRRRGGKRADEFVAAGGELPGPGLEVGEPLGEVFGLEGAVLERGQVLARR